MNYYPHHIGDYITATAHLTMIEDGAYRRLLDLYYSTEKALPGDRKALYRLARARTKEEQTAIDVVVEEFFSDTEEGWLHSRCDEEIEKAKALAERAKANGRKGGRPPKGKPSDNPGVKKEDGKNNPEETQPVISGFSENNPEKTQTEPSDNPEAKPPIPIPIPNKNISSPNADFTGVRFQEFWETWPKTERRTAKAECLKKWKLRHLDAIADRVLEHVKAMKATKKWQDGFEPAPLTYINQKHWEDGLPNQVDDDVFSRAAL